MKLSIVIPAWNEEKRFLPVLENYYNYFSQKLGNDFEMVIVPNNCSDNTETISTDFAKGRENVKVIIIPKSFGYVGKGSAVLKGFGKSASELIGFVDADGSTSPEEFYKLFQNIGNNDGIIASRKMRGAKIIPRRRLSQEISSFMYTLTVKILFGFKYKDTQCGAKIFKKDLIRIFIKKVTQKYWMFDVELLYLAKINKKKILEFPTLWTDCDGSHLTFFAGIGGIFDLFKYRISIFF
jgi:glycosyltransferase involved in cell wall biosynthesis